MGPAAFVELGGASVGFQIGRDVTDLIMVFIDEDCLSTLLKDRVELETAGFTTWPSVAAPF